ncbi:hypothetical protein LCGC14_1028430, partial [marine sediment metagenome]
VLGIKENAEGRVEIGRGLEGANTAELEAIVRLMNAIADRDKEMTAQGLLGDEGKVRPGMLDQGFSVDHPGFFKNEYFASIDEAQRVLGERIKAVFTGSADAMRALEDEIINRTSDPKRRKDAQLSEIAKADAKITEARLKATKAENDVRRSINDKIADLKVELDKGNSEIEKISKEIRIAQSARDLATSLKDMVKEFKKAEAAVIIKLKSDLEGPFARVGKPGFKTDFEKRREELKSGSMRPMTLDQMRERTKARKQLAFDEKEAKIQQKQKIETDALRRQQQRAEQVRTKMQEVMADPNQEAGIRAQAKSFFETLGDELEVSEQAEMRGKDLFFKGIPSLDNLEGLADDIAAAANKRVRELKTLDLREAFEPQLKVAQDQLAELRQIRKGLTTGTPTDTGDVSIDDFGATGTVPGGTDFSRVASTTRSTTSSGTRSAGATTAGTGTAPGLTSAELVKAYGDAAKVRDESIHGPASNAKEAGIGGGLLTALGTLVKGTSPVTGSAASIKTPMGMVTNTVQKIGDDLVVAASHLDGQVVGLQEFDIVHGEGGAKSLRARHITGDAGAGLELPAKAQQHGVGSNRLAKVMEYGQAEGFTALESTERVTAGQTGAYESAARKTGLNVIDNLSGAPDSPALKVPLKPQGIMDKIGNFRAGQEGAFTGSKWLKGGKALGAAGTGLEAYQMASTMIGAESAQTPEELNKYGGQLAGQTLGIGGVAAMATAGGVMAGPGGALAGGLIGGVGMAADALTGAGSLDYAGQYWNEKSGGMFGNAAQMGGKALMAPGNYLGDKFGQTGIGQSLAEMNVPTWLGGPGTPEAPRMSDADAYSALGMPNQMISSVTPTAPIMSSADAYAALGMPNQLTGERAPGGAAPKTAAPDLYSEEQMRWEGGTGGKGKNKQWMGSASNRAGHTLIPEDILAGGAGRGDNEALNLNEYIQRMQDSRAAQAAPLPTGPSGRRQGLDQQAQHENLQAVTPAAETPDQRDTAQRVESETRRAESGGGSEALASAIDDLNSKLESLTDIKIDTSEITTAIGVSTTEIVGALGSELSVSVSNPTFDVNVLSLPAGTTTDAASAGGPDVTVLAANLENLLGVQDIQKTQLESHETRLSTGEITDTQQNSDIATLQTDTQGLDANTISTQITSEIATAQTTIQGQVNDAIVVVDGKVVANTALINIARATADEALTVADALDGQIQAASDTSIEAKNTADATKKVADATKIVADNAAIVATAAQSEASLATSAIDKITQTVNANRQSIEAEVRTVKGTVDTNTGVGTENAKAIRKLAGDVVKADNIAQTANARANQR